MAAELQKAARVDWVVVAWGWVVEASRVVGDTIESLDAAVVVEAETEVEGAVELD